MGQLTRPGKALSFCIALSQISWWCCQVRLRVGKNKYMLLLALIPAPHPRILELLRSLPTLTDSCPATRNPPKTAQEGMFLGSHAHAVIVDNNKPLAIIGDALSY